MALDFPNSPTLNQTFTSPNGTIWMWDGVKWVAITSTSAYAGQGNVGRNLLHNPLFNVAQRGAGPWTSTQYTVDRWTTAFASDTISYTQQPLADSYRSQIGDEAAEFALANTFTGNAAAGAYNYVAQKIENVRRLAGKTVTVSFYATCGTGTPKLGVSLYQIFGTGGSPSANVQVNGQSITIGTTFARYSVTFAVPSIIGKTLGTNNDHSTWLNFWYSCGATNALLSGNVGVQSGTFWLWGVQLEVGSVATPLDYGGSLQQQFAECQRFYLFQGSAPLLFYAPVAGAPGSSMFTFPVTMRATPTVSLGLTGTNGTSQAASAANGGVMLLYCIAVAAGQVNVAFNFTASADL